MTRFLLFAGLVHYPDGGAGDFRGAFASADEARAAFDKDPRPGRINPYMLEAVAEWAEIARFDGTSLEVVEMFTRESFPGRPGGWREGSWT